MVKHLDKKHRGVRDLYRSGKEALEGLMNPAVEGIYVEPPLPSDSWFFANIEFAARLEDKKRKAFHDLEMAANSGHADAAFVLGTAFLHFANKEKGDILIQARLIRSGLGWFSKAAELGHEGATLELAKRSEKHQSTTRPATAVTNEANVLVSDNDDKTSLVETEGTRAAAVIEITRPQRRGKEWDTTLDDTEIQGLYEQISSNRKKLLCALVGQPEALAIIVGWYNKKPEDDDDKESYQYFMKTIWSRTGSRAEKGKKESDDEIDDGVDESEQPPEQEMNASLNDQMSSYDHWTSIGQQSRSLWEKAKKKVENERSKSIRDRLLVDLVESILLLRPDDKHLLDLADRLKSIPFAQRSEEQKEAVRQLNDAIQKNADCEKTVRAKCARIVKSMARKYKASKLGLEDLESEGNIGLLTAIRRYDPSKSENFKAYAIMWMRAAITQAIVNQGNTIRIPMGASERLRRYHFAKIKFENEHNREPSVTEVAELMCVSEQIAKRVMSDYLLGTPDSLDAIIGPNRNGNSRGDFVEDVTQTDRSFSAVFQQQSREVLTRILMRLKPREEYILRLRMGMHPNQEHTLEAISDKFGVTKERIRQVEVRALSRLRRPARLKEIKKNFDLN